MLSVNAGHIRKRTPISLGGFHYNPLVASSSSPTSSPHAYISYKGGEKRESFHNNNGFSSTTTETDSSSAATTGARRRRGRIITVIGLGFLLCLGLGLIGFRANFHRIMQQGFNSDGGPQSIGGGGSGSRMFGAAGVGERVHLTKPQEAAPAWSITDLDEEGGGGRYDYSRSTTEIYGLRSLGFWGPYAEIRESLDYDFHSNYVQERQAIQDQIIQRILDRGSSSSPHHDDDDGALTHVKKASPRELGPDCRRMNGGDGEGNQWIVFTAGPMGAGKSHTLRWLSKRGYFPLDDYVVVSSPSLLLPTFLPVPYSLIMSSSSSQGDPDNIRNELPEIEGYIKVNPSTAGSLTHREAG